MIPIFLLIFLLLAVIVFAPRKAQKPITEQLRQRGDYLEMYENLCKELKEKELEITAKINANS